MRIQIVTGMMEYCGIPNCELHLLFDVLDDRAARDRHLATARELGKSYFGRVGVEASEPASPCRCDRPRPLSC